MTFGNHDCIHSDDHISFCILINKLHSMPFLIKLSPYKRFKIDSRLQFYKEIICVRIGRRLLPAGAGGRQQHPQPRPNPPGWPAGMLVLNTSNVVSVQIKEGRSKVFFVLGTKSLENYSNFFHSFCCTVSIFALCHPHHAVQPVQSQFFSPPHFLSQLHRPIAKLHAFHFTYIHFKYTILYSSKFQKSRRASDVPNTMLFQTKMSFKLSPLITEFTASCLPRTNTVPIRPPTIMINHIMMINLENFTLPSLD